MISEHAVLLINYCCDYRLVCGDVDGNFKQLFSRVASVQKKAGPFEVNL